MPEEDQQILKHVTEIGREWDQIRRLYMPSRASKDIANRWNSITRPRRSESARPIIRRRWWSAQEDNQLNQLVARHGSKDWPRIAACLGEISSRMCRQRWMNHLRPLLSKGEWTPIEDQALWETVTEVGPKWVQISSEHMPCRSEVDLLNRWNLIIRRPLAPSGGEWTAAELPIRAYFLSNHPAHLCGDIPCTGPTEILPDQVAVLGAGT